MAPDDSNTPWWLRARNPLLPEPRLLNGFEIPGHEFSEYTSPYRFHFAREALPAVHDAQAEEAALKRAFQVRYPLDPPHPEWRARTPAFLRADRCLIAQLACAHAIALLRANLLALATEADRFFLDAVSEFGTDAFLAAWHGLDPWEVYWLNQPGSRVLSSTSHVIGTSRDQADDVDTASPDSEEVHAGWGNLSSADGHWDANTNWGQTNVTWGQTNVTWGQTNVTWGEDVEAAWGEAVWPVNPLWAELERLRHHRSQSHRVRRGRRNMGRTFRKPRTLTRPRPSALDLARKQYHILRCFVS